VPPQPDTTPDFEQAKALFLAGLASFEAGRFGEAEQQYLTSLALVPGRVSTLINLAGTQLKLGHADDALTTTAQVLAIEPDSVDAWFHRGTALAQSGCNEPALAAYDKALQLDPALGAAWSHRGGILRELNRLDEAADSFRQALAHGADAELNGYYLAAVAAQHSPATAPRQYVQALFDDYAGQFDAHLVGVLKYQAHEVLARHLAALGRGPFKAALDLGCGTGLCGPLVKPMASHLVGVDLSAAMLDKARALGVYDGLAQADIVEHLRSTPQRHDLVLAADVFIYVGDMAPVFGALDRVIEPGGVFCFSAEEAGPGCEGFELLPSLRFAHSQAYLARLAEQHGFDVVKIVREPIRKDQREPIDGLFMYLCKR
jgi:predicted TPR repeat methyltransferase